MTNTKARSAKASLLALATETLHSIIYLLDPVDIIALSQVCCHMRQIVNPQRSDFVDRLLTLECRDEYGGRDPIFRNKKKVKCFPPRVRWDKEVWEKNRWACSGCLKLLPYTSFGNDMLVRPRYRKPLPNTPQGNFKPGWRPSLRGKPWGRKALMALSKEEKASLRRRARYAVDSCYGYDKLVRQQAFIEEARILGLEWDEEKIVESVADLLAEMNTEDPFYWEGVYFLRGTVPCAGKRHLRKCNDCRFRSKEFQTRQFRSMEVRLPIVYGKPLWYEKMRLLRRFFPNYWESYTHKMPNRPVLESVLNMVEFEQGYQTFRIRCPQCQTWPEYREFRYADFLSPDSAASDQGITPPKACRGKCGPYCPCCRRDENPRQTDRWLSSMRPDWVCQRCYANEHGKEALAPAMVRYLHWAQDVEMRGVEVSLCKGWENLRGLLDEYEEGVRYVKGMFVSEDWARLKNFIDLTEPLLERKRRKQRFARAELEASRTRIFEVNKIWVQVRDPRCWDFSWEFSSWVCQYDSLMTFWIWLYQSIAEVKENPMPLVDWALSLKE